jgi:hypothetical protein
MDKRVYALTHLRIHDCSLLLLPSCLFFKEHVNFL